MNRHIPETPRELRDPGISDSQCWGTLALAALVGAFVGCAFNLLAAALAMLLVMVGCVLSLWVHRRRQLVIAYHQQRLKHGRLP